MPPVGSIVYMLAVRRRVWGGESVCMSKMGTEKEYERRFRETGLLKPSEIPSVLWSQTILIVLYLERIW